MYNRRLVLTGLALSLVATGYGAQPAEDFSSMRGANYVPSYARNDVQLWLDFDPAVIDRELGYAQRLRLNTVRVFLQFAVYEREPQRFLERFETSLALCAKHELRMMPVVFDSCFGEFPDLERYRDKDWMANPGQNRLGQEHWPKLEQYVRDVVGGHQDDRRIVMWDVMNEPTCTSFNKPADKQLIFAFLEHFLEYVKQQRPRQPLTVGWEHSSLIERVLTQTDALCIHNYRRDLREDIRRVQELGRRHGKPVIVNEVVGRPQQPFSYVMPILREEKVGWCFWELMLGKTQFSRAVYPYQGLIYPDATCFDASEVACVMDVSLEVAQQLFPQRPPPKFEEDGISFQGYWTRWTGAGPLRGRLFYATDPKSTVGFAFAGTSVALVHKVGPDCGIARVLIDGKPAAVPEIDTYASQVEWNRRTRVAQDLPPGRHLVTVLATGRKNGKSSNCYVQIVGFQSGPGQ
jgi:hypothetical protein